jgi:hypothetical protein
MAVRGRVTTARADVSASVEVPQPAYASLITRVTNYVTGSPAANGPVFVLKSGTVLSVGNYQYQDGRVTYTLIGGGGGVLNSEDVDWTATTQVNNQHGIRMTLHGGHVSPETAGF